MLLDGEKERLAKITQDLKSFSQARSKTLSLNDNRRYFATLRDAFHLFEDVVFRLNKAGAELAGKDGKTLLALAEEAIMKLGGVVDSNPISLKDYEHHLHGPYLGVSDEGSAASIIRRAAFSSPKLRVLGAAPPIEVGVAHDAERLAAVGEVSVGPEEYRDIILQCHGSILTSTNVGTRLNLRYYKLQPVIIVPHGSFTSVMAAAKENLQSLVQPFWHTPANVPRPVTLLLAFAPGTRFSRRLEILRKLQKIMAPGDFCDPRVHHLGLLARVGPGKKGVKTVLANLELAAMTGVTTLAVRGVVQEEAADKISMPGLLNYFPAEYVNLLLKNAREKNVLVVPKNRVDPDTVARNVWSSLQAARHMGLALGKYGLFPLTIEESSEVMGLIQSWFADWSAAPVFYIDFPIAGRRQVYTEENIVAGAKEWLDEVAHHGIPVVLFDTADKDKGRRLLKQSPADRVGIFSLAQVSEIDHYAAALGVKSLWAGGISIPQTFEFGKLQVFGVYVTSAAAATRPVSKRYARDPFVVAEKEPTFKGVSRVKLLLEAGFLVSCLGKAGLQQEADTLEQQARAFINLLLTSVDKAKLDSAQTELATLTEKGWRRHYRQQNFKIK
jgi:hypothetical protein